MPAWRVARALDTLLAEINARSPKRSTLSDGSIGDAAHASRTSDHNPWVKDGAMGVVTARDFTNDPAHGFDSSNFADWLRRRCRDGAESRVKYIISNRLIASPIQRWAWRPYNGLNAHLHHVHVSVLPAKSKYDSTASWGWLASPALTPARPFTPQENPMSPTAEEIAAAVWSHPRRLTRADAEAMGGDKRSGDPTNMNTLLRFPPAVARLRREQTAQIGALTRAVAELAKGDLTADQICDAAQAGARAALEQFEHDHVSDDGSSEDAPS